jgi:hypothetical protein
VTYRTNRPIKSHAFCQTAGGNPIGDAWTLPAGARVHLIKGFEGGTRDGFVAADVAQLKALSGNTHDPVYRYMQIDPLHVEGVGAESVADVERLRQEAEQAATGRNVLHYALTYEEARAAKLASGSANDWIDAGDFRALPARAALCRTGNGHARVIRDWNRVNCRRCIAQRVN